MRNRIKRLNPGRFVVQARNEAIGLAAVFQESVAHLHVDLLQGLQAIARKTWANHIDVFGACFGQFTNGGLGVGLKPLGLAKARLESDFVLCGLESQSFGQEASRFVALAVVEVSQVKGSLGHTVKAHHQKRGFGVGAPMRLHSVGQGLDVGRVVMVVVDETVLWDDTRLLRPGVKGVKNAGCGGAGILRIGR